MRPESTSNVQDRPQRGRRRRQAQEEAHEEKSEESQQESDLHDRPRKSQRAQEEEGVEAGEEVKARIRPIEACCMIRMIPESRPGHYTGGGVCVSADGIIATVRHVILDKRRYARKLLVQFHDDESTSFMPAEVLSSYPRFDLAFIRVLNPKRVFPYVEIPENINLHGNTPTPFVSGVGHISYPFPTDTVFPNLDSTSVITTSHQLASLVPSFVPHLTAQYTKFTYDFDLQLHPDLPLIATTGSPMTEGWSGSPIFTRLDNSFLGLLSMGSDNKVSYHIPSPIISTAFRLLRPGVIGTELFKKLENFNLPWEGDIQQPLALGPNIRRSVNKPLYSRQVLSAYNRRDTEVQLVIKSVALQTSMSVVCVAVNFQGKMSSCCGIIIDCQSSDDFSYLTTILAPASIFKPIQDVSEIEINVMVSTGVSIKGHLLDVDHHYNLAAITFISDCRWPVVVFHDIDDVLSVDPDDQLFSRQTHSLKMVPDMRIFTVNRSHSDPLSVFSDFGVCSLRRPEGLDCNEVYMLRESFFLNINGLPALDINGNVIGIILAHSILPNNIVSRWWAHYKTFRVFRRPFTGLEVINLHEVGLDFLVKFLSIFPNTFKAVVVTKVEEDSPGGRCGLRVGDVIVSLDTKLVQSKIQFYEAVWENVGKAVTLTAYRVAEEVELHLTLLIEEKTDPNKFNEWPHLSCDRVWW